jgi:hypothetical protein
MIIILFLLLALILLGVGFTIHFLWVVAGIFLVLWILGFVVGSGRWYHW